MVGWMASVFPTHPRSPPPFSVPQEVGFHGLHQRAPSPSDFQLGWTNGKQWQENRAGKKLEAGIFIPLAPSLSAPGLAVAVFLSLDTGGPLLSSSYRPLRLWSLVPPTHPCSLRVCFLLLVSLP